MSETQLNERNTMVGNLVKYDGKIYEIDTIAAEFPTLNTAEFGIGVVDWNNIEPIPLTPEILVRLGATKTGLEFGVNENYGFNEYELGGFHFGQFEEGVFICNELDQLFSDDRAKFTSVHRVQNFIESTGQELTYTP